MTTNEKVTITDACDEGALHVYDVAEPIITVQTKRQKIEINNIARFGVSVWIDGWPQCAEYDSDRYHEALAHPALIHRADEGTAFSACILGGGDFGLVNQLVKYKNLSKVHMIDWDLEFTELAKKHLSSINHGTWSDPRVHVETKTPDVFEFFTVCKERFDIVFGDLTDLTSMGSGVKSFIENIKGLVVKDGLFVSQSSEYPTMPGQLDEFISMVRMVQSVFKHAWIYRTYIPSFAYEQAFIIATDSEFNPLELSIGEVDKKIAALSVPVTEYSGALHHAMFAMPPSLLKKL